MPIIWNRQVIPRLCGLFFVLEGILCPAARAYYIHGGGGYDTITPAETTASIVRDSTGKIVATSNPMLGLGALDYMNQISASGIWSSVDMDMQQCFSGGFARDAQSSLALRSFNFTIGTSCRFDQVSFGSTQAWTDSWQQNNDLTNSGLDSMSNNFLATINGRGTTTPPVLKDQNAASAPSTGGRPAQTQFEYPQYDSPDAMNGPYPNDNRSIPGNASNWYAIIVAWDATGTPADSFINKTMLEAYDTLTRVYRVPTNNIGVLYFNGTGNTTITTPTGVAQALTGTIPNPAGGTLTPTMQINGNNSAANWDGLLNGTKFWPNPPTRDNPAPLLIFNTGHGSSIYTDAAMPGVPDTFIWTTRPGNWASNWVAATANNLGSTAMASEVNSDGGINVQIATDAPLVSTAGASIQVNIDGYATTLPDLSPAIDDLTGIVGGNLDYYVIDVPTDYPSFDGFMQADGPGADITFSALANPDAVQAFTFDGGASDQTLLVPEPSGVSLLIIAFAVAARQRIRSLEVPVHESAGHPRLPAPN